MEPGSLWWCVAGGWGTTDIRWNKVFKLVIRKNFFTSRMVSATRCAVWLWHLHPWRPDWIEPWAAWPGLTADSAWAGGWTRDLPRSFPAWAVLWYCKPQGTALSMLTSFLQLKSRKLTVSAAFRLWAKWYTLLWFLEVFPLCKALWWFCLWVWRE